MAEITRFNIRVYGIMIEDGQLLLVDEQYRNREISKFPGGGLLPGEGTIECLQREIKEELNMQVEVTSHFYTTDFFQRSVFKDTDQVFSIYYIIERIYKEQPINYSWQEVANEHKVKFKWVKMSELHPDMLTFPIDKKVAEMILAQYTPM